MDFDGFIRPTMGGLEPSADLSRLREPLVARYGAGDAAGILGGNVVRVLRTVLLES